MRKVLMASQQKFWANNSEADGKRDGETAGGGAVAGGEDGEKGGDGPISPRQNWR